EHEPPLAHTLNKDVPKALAEIAARAMEKDPEHRFRSARALSRELRHWLAEHGQANDGAGDARGRRRLHAVWAGVATAALLVGAAAWWASTSHKHAGEAVLASPSQAEAAQPATQVAAPVVAP